MNNLRKVARTISVILLSLICITNIFGLPSYAAGNDGICRFQEYVNANTPESFLPVKISQDGYCGNKTKAAAQKLADYYSSQDNGFYTIRRYDTGKWVYLIQGLLYCHGYDPKGFDGNYGTSGGTGMLNAVNKYKQDHGFLVTENGEVDELVLNSLLWDYDVNIKKVVVPQTESEKPICTFTALSDIHINGNYASEHYVSSLIQAFDDMRRIETLPGSVCITGDLTENGFSWQYDGLKIATNRFPQLNCTFSMGNHDTGIFSTNDFDACSGYFKNFCNAEKTYYDKWICGIHFIVLGSEAQLQDQAYISDAQLSWLSEKLAENADEDKPIFVLCHWPLKDTHQRTNEDVNNIGAQDERLKEILSDYPQVIYLSGHVHNGLNETTYIKKDGINCILLPTAKCEGYGYNTEHVYMYFQVYSDKVKVFARDYQKKQWLDDYSFEIEIPKKPSKKYFIQDNFFMNVDLKTDAVLFEKSVSDEYTYVKYSENRFVGTGENIVSKLTGEQFSIVIKNDVSGDGMFTSTDYLMLKKHFDGIPVLSDAQCSAGDINNDGRITTMDYIFLRLCFKE